MSISVVVAAAAAAAAGVVASAIAVPEDVAVVAIPN